MLSFAPLLLLLLCGATHGAEYHIKDASQFISFANSVNNGNTYSSYTVFLDSDIDFTGKTMSPIGSSESRYFIGTLDGQGHTISNLKMTVSSQFAGLFGYTRGMTVRNVVVDESCSVVCTSGSNYVYVGGILGEC